MTSLEVLFKASAILLAAFAATRLMRRSPASLRHFVWTAAFAALLILPAAMMVGPKWTPPVGAPIAVPQTTTHIVAAPVAPASVPPISLSSLWWIGFALTAARFTAGAARTAWIARRARPIGMQDGVRIVESPLAPMPMTWGIVRPVIILPPDASAWPADRSRAVLLHELTHVRRRDLLAQAIAQTGSCLYWFHPLAWMALRELRKERELACDDGVLATGIAAHEYAGHVMDLARGLAARRGSLADAPAMADMSGLESRIRAMLDRERNRRPLRPLAAMSIAAVALAALLPLASFTAMAQGANGAVAGTVQDASGARVPSVTVTALNLDTTAKETTRANAVGEYQFQSLPSGRYLIEVGAPGFKHWKAEFSLVAGAAVRRDAFLEVGSIAEAVRVVGRPGQPAAAPTAVAPARVRVGGNVQQARLVRQPKPVYPEDLKQAGVQGVVKIAAILGKDGVLTDMRVIGGDPRLVSAALDSVRQWRYTPTLLNGEPIEITTQIDVSFELGQ